MKNQLCRPLHVMSFDKRARQLRSLSRVLVFESLRLLHTRFLLHNRRARWAVRLSVGGLLLGLLAGHPWIAAWLAEGRLESMGGEHNGRREVSYERIVWHGLAWSDENVDVTMERVELGLIPRFISTWMSPQPSLEADMPFFSMTGVDIVLENEGDGQRSPDPTVPAWNQKAADVLETLERWLPPVAVEDVEFNSPSVKVSMVSGIWDGMTLSLDGIDASAHRPFPVDAERAVVDLVLQRSGTGFNLDLDGDVGPWRELVLRLQTQGDNERLKTHGTLRWAGGALRGEATWSDFGWMPITAVAHGTLSQFVGTPLDREDVMEAEAVLEFALEGTAFEIQVNGEGLWESPDPSVGVVPWKIAVQAAATPERYRVSRLDVSLPWLEAELGGPLDVDRETLTPEAAAELAWQTDFSTWPWLTLQGSGSGRAHLSPESEEGLRFDVSGEAQIESFEMLPEAYRKFGALSFEVEGRAGREQATVDALSIETAKWGNVVGNGSWDSAGERDVEGQLEATLHTAGIVPWLPEWTTVSGPIEIAGRFHREAGEWHHAGRLREPAITLHGTVPLMLEADWEGTAKALSQWDVRAEGDEAALQVTGSASWGAAQEQITLSSLEETQANEKRWTLLQPVSLSRRSGDAGDGWSLELLKLVSAQSEASLEAEGTMENFRSGQLRLAIHEIGADDLSGWYPIGNSQWFVEQMDALGRVSDGAVEMETQLLGRWTPSSGEPWHLAVDAHLGADGLEIAECRISSPASEWLRSSGFIPLTIRRSAKGGWEARLNGEQEAKLNLALQANEPLPPFFSEQLPVSYENLRISVELGGALRDLGGEMTVSGGSLSIETAGELLRLEEPELHAVLSEGDIEVETLAFQLPRAPARARASATVEAIPWDALETRRMDLATLLKEIKLVLRTDAFPVAAVAPFLPDVMESSGTVTVDLTKDGEADVTGTLSWEGLNLRPLPNGAVPRNVRGEARLAGRRLEAIDLQASISGRTVRATGNANFEHWPEPLFDLQVEAERLDLVRQLDLILRAAGNFQLVRTSLDESPLISGQLTLQDSLLLRDLRDFTRQGAVGVPRRPPYFSVESEALADWRLDVDVEGDEFMRVRTPVFTGVVSADFQLQGTLGDPAAVGQATIEEGAVLFPFAKIPLNSGRASIALSDPHTLRLYAQGRGVIFGYDVVLQLDGTAREPELIFSSPQGLAQDEIVLMLATGAVPSSEGGSSDATRAGRIALYLGQDIFSTLFGSGDNASKIEIRSGEGFSPYRRSNQVIEYHFTEDWSVLGENDDFGDYNVDLKRTVYRK